MSPQHRSGGMEAGVPHGLSSGKTRPYPGRGHLSAGLSRSSSLSAQGTPGDLAGAEDPHSHLTGRGAGPRRGAAGLSGAEEGEGWVPGCPPAAGRAGKGPGSLCGQLPVTAAAGKAAGAGSCPVPAAPLGVLSPAGSGDSPAWVPFAPAAGRDKGCLLLGCPTLHVCWCSPAAEHPSSPERVVCPWGELAGAPHVKLGGGSLRSSSQQIKSRYPCPVLLRVSLSLKTSSGMPRDRDRQPPGMARLCHAELPVPGTRTRAGLAVRLCSS